MRIEDLTDEQIAYYQAAQRSFGPRWSNPGPSLEDAKRQLGWAFDPTSSVGGEYSKFSRELSLALEWSFRILEHLSEDHISQPKSSYTNPGSWEELDRLVRAHVQAAYQTSLEDAEEEYPSPWKDGTYFAKSVSWFMRNLTPFTIWVIHQRVEDAVLDDMRDNIVAWSAGENSGAHKVSEKAFNNALRGIEEWLDKKTAEGVSQSAA